MVNFQENQNRELTLTGNGQPVWFGLYQNDQFVKMLATGVATAAGVAQTQIVNAQPVGGADHIPLGDNWDIVIANEVSHPVAGISVGDPIADITNGGVYLPTKFSIVATPEDVPEIFWNDYGNFISGNEVYTDSAATNPSEYAIYDAVNGVVGNMAVKKNPTVATDLFTLEQSVTARKPPFRFNDVAGVKQPYIDFSEFTSFTADHELDVVGGVTVTNNSFIDSFYAVDIQTTSGSSFNAFGLILPDDVEIAVLNSTRNYVNVIGSSLNFGEGRRVVHVRRSAGAAFGASELYIDGVLEGTNNVYFPTVTMRPQMRGYKNSIFAAGIVHFYAGLICHDGALNENERKAVTEMLGRRMGLSLSL